MGKMKISKYIYPAQKVPSWIRAGYRQSKIHLFDSIYACTGPFRALPDFLIIGAAKAGTTSLYDYLVQHPQILPARVKEIFYFSCRYDRSLSWYRSYFPFRTQIESTEGAITGEATPYYLPHPRVPERVHRLLPNVKLIVLLRNPVERAFSDYNHCVRWGFEDAPTFEEGLEREPARLEAEREQFEGEAPSECYNHRRFAYCSRGLYAEQLERWWQLFSREQTLILKAEDLFEHAAAAYAKTVRFLGLSDWAPAKFKVQNLGSYQTQMLPETRSRLEEYFREPNRRLQDLIGTEFAW